MGRQQFLTNLAYSKLRKTNLRLKLIDKHFYSDWRMRLSPTAGLLTEGFGLTVSLLRATPVRPAEVLYSSTHRDCRSRNHKFHYRVVSWDSMREDSFYE